MARVFVTGATGFIGQHLCERLVERGDHVVALVRSQKKSAALPASVERLDGDLSMLCDPKLELPPSDVVIHLAGVVAAKRPAEYAAINHRAVADIVACLERQRWKPKRLLFASSLAAAGPSPPDRPWREIDAVAPIDAYGIAKAEAEDAVRAASFPTTIFRPPMVFGPNDPATLTLFKSALSGVGMRVAGAPQRLSFVDVRDLVEAIVLMADDPRPGSFVYFTSHPREFDVRELWQNLGNAVGREVNVLPVPRWGLFLAMRAATLASAVIPFKNQLDEKQYRQMAAPAFVCSSESLRDELGWRPRYDLTECLAHAADGYRQSGKLAS
jgi:dihydroflavonol-4-reductase